MILLDSELTVRALNPAAQALLGWRPDQAAGRPDCHTVLGCRPALRMTPPWAVERDGDRWAPRTRALDPSYWRGSIATEAATPRWRTWRVYWGDPPVVPRPAVGPGAEDSTARAAGG